MPRFVLLRHELPAESQRASHWDLMLEAGGVLKTWELIALWEDQKSVTARRLPDHRLDYLEYEGPVSSGRGTVRAVDRGTFETLAHDQHHWLVRLDGGRYKGTLLVTVLDKSRQWWSVRFCAATETT
ncbi:MAG: hypothetical protein KatS3mg109_0681 [Pirellulaceae bacterium]|nr:MAG: hypothetical protein KatS3mg109_0681 [Pirellulaceae bacterium]